MKRYYRIFRRGGGATAATISGLILASALIAGLMIGCKEESSKPTAPSIPVGPDWQTSENSTDMGFYSGKGDGEFGAYAGTNNEFQISVPAGDYVLEYTVQNTSTNSIQAVAIDGPYYVVFRASEASVLTIGLFNSVNITSNVSSAVVRHGTLKSFSSSNVWISNSVTLICWPGGGISSWKNAIEINTSRLKIVLIQNGVVASGVKSLPAPSQRVERPAPAPQPAPEPQTPTPTQSPTFSCNANETLAICPEMGYWDEYYCDLDSKTLKKWHSISVNSTWEPQIIITSCGAKTYTWRWEKRAAVTTTITGSGHGEECTPKEQACLSFLLSDTPTPTVTATPAVTQTPGQTEKVMLPGPYHDAEKLASEDGSMMCWAAAPANALMWGGWATGFSNAQDVFRKFQEYWKNSWLPGGPGPKDSLSWWFGGDGALSSTIKANYLEKTGGGNYWPGESLSNYYSEGSFSLDSVNSKIRDQYVVMITATQGLGGHWINVWGFEKDASKPNEEYLYITDNQDGDANNPTPKRVTAKLESGVWRLSDYTYMGQTGWDIGEMAALKKK